MTINNALDGLPRASLVEAIYRVSKIVSRSPHNLDSKSSRVRYLRPEERRRIAIAVADIISEIEKASDFNIDNLPVAERAEVLGKLYQSLFEHIAPESDQGMSGDELLEELYEHSDAELQHF